MQPKSLVCLRWIQTATYSGLTYVLCRGMSLSSSLTAYTFSACPLPLLSQDHSE
ncbi:hypothetical protein BV25DRAFT_1733233 [Artomyces pyxidatus]|uniref:Uncharacterized protein n=2 Tax=Artomyces pyxidatus TaxID=48021 RepID=A0ACB8SIL3_9AGAM|nr:hypothetical protein BV25DRAFT_1733219 [Artomyces pyxidatus]KAI0055743.1 hypothetical protein BV25DRAFT_1733233 [Artomyces pyxidatus]